MTMKLPNTRKICLESYDCPTSLPWKFFLRMSPKKYIHVDDIKKTKLKKYYNICQRNCQIPGEFAWNRRIIAQLLCTVKSTLVYYQKKSKKEILTQLKRILEQRCFQIFSLFIIHWIVRTTPIQIFQTRRMILISKLTIFFRAWIELFWHKKT